MSKLKTDKILSSGFIVVDKPQGISSFDVIRELRKKLQIKKMGHLGTLDPMATGVLVVALNKATKLIQFLMGANKEYEAEITLGKISDTYDAEGKLQTVPQAEKIIKDLNLSFLQKIISENFTGKILQLPPQYSALKINGQKAYDLARQGQEVKLKPRQIEIFDFEILNYQTGKITARIHCGSGTYIRSIAHDLGQILQCGGYLTALRRTKVGQFDLAQAQALAQVSVSQIQPLLEMIPAHWTHLKLDEFETAKILQGQPISTQESYTIGQLLALIFGEKLIAIGHAKNQANQIWPKKVI